jgi:hypothetical protein
MPAVPAALAEIQDRLEEIRYRLNRTSLIAVLCPVLGVLFVLAALLTWSAARATAESFALAAYAAAAAAVLVLLRTGLALWGRWLSLADVARLADARGRMQDRLTTVLWLARSGKRPPLAPVLVADTVGRRAAWEVSRIASRRWPYELAYPAAGLLVLAAVVLLAPEPPATLPDQLASHPPAERQMEMAVPQPPPPPARRQELRGGPLLEASGDTESGEPGSEPAGGKAGARQGAALTAQLRGAIREALGRLEQTERARDLAKGDAVRAESADAELPSHTGLRATGIEEPTAGESATGSQPPGEGRERDSAEGALEARARSVRQDAAENTGREHQPPRGPNDKPRDRSRAAEGSESWEPGKDGKAASMPGTDKPLETTEGKGAGGASTDEIAGSPKKKGGLDRKGESREQGEPSSSSESDGRGRQPGGARAASGSGTDPEGLYASTGGRGSRLGQGTPAGTFKLTLGSFLADGPAGGGKPRGDERAAAADGRAAVSEPPALNPRQTADDALRRADIPPEYEEIVRRIYSARPAR